MMMMMCKTYTQMQILMRNHERKKKSVENKFKITKNRGLISIPKNKKYEQ